MKKISVPPIIGLAGQQGVGKSTIAEIIKQMYNNVEIVKFAQPLYDIQYFMYERCGLKQPIPKDRKLLQWIGTEWGRSIDPDLWIDLWAKEVNDILIEDSTKLIICDDVRFDNEAEVIKANGGIVVGVRSKVIRIEKSGIKHASEKGIKSEFIDGIINNDGSIDDLKKQVEFLLECAE